MKNKRVLFVVSISLLSVVVFIHCPVTEPYQTDGNDDDSNSSIFTNFDVGSSVYEIAIDAAGGKWIGTGDGVLYLDDNGTPTKKTDDTWISFTTATGW